MSPHMRQFHFAPVADFPKHRACQFVWVYCTHCSGYDLGKRPEGEGQAATHYVQPICRYVADKNSAWLSRAFCDFIIYGFCGKHCDCVCPNSKKI